MPDIFSKERITKPNVNIDFQKFHFQNYLVFVCRTIPFAWNLITAGYVEQTIPGVIFHPTIYSGAREPNSDYLYLITILTLCPFIFI